MRRGLEGVIGGSDDPGGPRGGLLFDNTQDYAMWAFTARREKYGLERAPEGLDGFAPRELVLRMTDGWHPRLRGLVRASDPSTVTLLPIRSSVPVEHWETKNVTAPVEGSFESEGCFVPKTHRLCGTIAHEGASFGFGRVFEQPDHSGEGSLLSTAFVNYPG